MPERSEASDQNKRDLGQRLREARKARRLVLAGVARSTGVSAAFLSEVERGKKTPSASTVITLANLYQVDPVPLLNLAHPEMEVSVLETSPPQPEGPPRSVWSYTNAINDLSFRYGRRLERRGVDVSPEAKEFIRQVYEGMWDLQLQSSRADMIYEQAIRDSSFSEGKFLRRGPAQPEEVKVFIAELYLKFLQIKQEAERSVKDHQKRGKSKRGKRGQ